MDRFATFARILAEVGAPLAPPARILDLGCGTGILVQSACDQGLDGYGCDFDSGVAKDYLDQTYLPALKAQGRVRLIETPYRLPFEDAFFDCVISDQVVEHVMDWDATLAEIARVMKPGARFLHIFPPRLSLVEPHIFVPLGAAFHPRWWLTLWAVLGVRNPFQRGWSVARTVADNEVFMRTGVNYLPDRELMARFSRYFDARHVEAAFMKFSRNAKLFVFPGLYRALRQSCLYGTKR